MHQLVWSEAEKKSIGDGDSDSDSDNNVFICFLNVGIP